MTIQCRFDATRRVMVATGDPPDPDQSGFAGTIYVVQVCKQHYPDPRRSMPMPRPRTSTPIGERPRRGRPPVARQRGLPVHEVRHPVGVPHLAVAPPAEVPQGVARLLRGDSAEVLDPELG
jgi:hypothetical protein